MNKRVKLRQESGVVHDTAGRIITEAARLFAKKGYDGVSIKEISEAAGVNIAAVNYHFDSKDNLFLHIIEQFLTDLFASSRKILLPPKSPEDLKVRLEVFLRQTVEAIIRQPDVMMIVQREMERSDQVFQKTILKHRAALVEFLNGAKKDGLLTPDVDPGFAAEFLMGQISHGCRRGSVKKDLFGDSPAAEKFRNNWIEQTLRLFLQGVAGSSLSGVFAPAVK